MTFQKRKNIERLITAVRGEKDIKFAVSRCIRNTHKNFARFTMLITVETWRSPSFLQWVSEDIQGLFFLNKSNKIQSKKATYFKLDDNNRTWTLLNCLTFIYLWKCIEWLCFSYCQHHICWAVISMFNVWNFRVTFTCWSQIRVSCRRRVLCGRVSIMWRGMGISVTQTSDCVTHPRNPKQPASPPHNSSKCRSTRWLRFFLV